MSVKSRREANLEATRAAILDAAREGFVHEGYDRATLGEIAQAGGVTTGAIYHHFGSKAGLFEAVIVGILERLVARAAEAAAGAPGPWEKLAAAVDAILDTSDAPEVKLAFLGAPTVLGLDAWRALEIEHTAPLLGGVLAELVACGEVPGWPPQVLGPIVRGAVVEAAMVIAEADDPDAARRQSKQIVDRMIDSLRR